jgi:hypothetical protein
MALVQHQAISQVYDPFTFLGNFLPLRMHPKTREQIDLTVKRFKPAEGSFFYGIILANKTVVAIIKNDQNIAVVPTGNP